MSTETETSPSPLISRRTCRRILLGLSVALVLAIGWLVARPAYREFKQWRARRLAGESAGWLQAGDLAQAQTKAQAAWLLAPGEPAALRAMATALTRATNATALQFWARLLQTGHAGQPDRRSFVEQSIRAGAAGPAAQELQRLLNEAPQEPAHLWLASQLFTLLNDRAQTVHYAAQAVTGDPTNRQYNLFLSSLQFDAVDVATREPARSNVWARAGEQDALAAAAMEFLAQRKDLSPEQATQLTTLLRGHPSHATALDLLALGLEINAAPDRRALLLDQAVEKHLNAAPEARVQFAVWLNQLGEFDRTLQALPLTDARKRKDYFLAYMDALAGLNRWNDLLKTLEAPQTPLEPVYLKAFAARCQAELRNPALAELTWREALRAAERNAEQSSWLALYAEKCGEPETAKKALRSLIGAVEHPRPAFRELARLTEQSGTTVELRDLLVEMNRRWPKEPALQNDLAYLNLLLNTELAASWRMADTLSKQFPESLPFRTTLALALLRQRDAANALQVLTARRIDWTQALPNQRAIFAAVLAANGSAMDARQLLGNLRVEQLRPEESELVATLR